MTKRKLFLIFGISAFGVAATWHLVQPEGDADTVVATTGGTASMAIGSRSGRTLPDSSPPLARTSSPGNRRPVVMLKSALAIEFEKAGQLKPFYDRYYANPESADAETKYFAAVAIENCVGRARGSKEISDADRERFQTRLKENDPNNLQRTDAFTRVTAVCDGFAGVNISLADATKLYAESAAAGNPAAKIAMAASLFQDQARATTARGIEARRLSEEQLALVRDGLASGDPFAIQRAGPLLTWNSTQMIDKRLGASADPFMARDWASAWTLAACDRGANCGADAQRVLTGCAYQGACGYQSLEAYLQFNELPPNVFLAAQQNRATILDAIAQGRWDWLGIAAGSGRVVTNPPNTTGAASPGPRQTVVKPPAAAGFGG